MTMQIRQFQPGDKKLVARVHNDAFSEWKEKLGELYGYHHITPSEVLDWLGEDGKNDTLWVGELGGKMIGYTHCRPQVEYGKRGVPVVYFVATESCLGQSKIAIVPEHRKFGYSIDLVGSAIQHYEDKGTELAIVKTYSDNRAAACLLRRIGFVHYERHYYEPYSDEKPIAYDTVYAHLDLSKSLPDIQLNPSVIFRRASQDDIDDIVTIMRANILWSTFSHDPEWVREYVNGNHGQTVFVAEVDSKVVGAMDHYDSVVGITGVIPNLQRQGIGSTMFYRLLEHMKNKGLDLAFADSGITQEEAIRMYGRFGFTFPRRQHMWIKQLNVME